MPTLKSSLIKPSKSMLFFHIWNANFSVTPINSQMYMTKPKQVQKKLSENTGKTFSVIMPSFTCRGWAYLRKLLYTKYTYDLGGFEDRGARGKVRKGLQRGHKEEAELRDEHVGRPQDCPPRRAQHRDGPAEQEVCVCVLCLSLCWAPPRLSSSTSTGMDPQRFVWDTIEASSQ